MAETQRAPKNHVLTIHNREKLMATGIVRVDFFSDELITAQTDIGQLNIKGKSLHIETLSAETGDMLVTGKTEAVSYTDNGPALSFFGRLFK
ncbi:YabP/YqfC family sporulation protein [Scatolibacter rhodanostii]|uniref:YabP/YqfC family sporulation protein n=1 Tax=Scatolibacter rhodanostii TaxID=2014781 RepID=UPI000C0881F0|nr:YabP/YqfC family sporulation protein [Scatolibacter rhodanostii]